MNYKSFTFVPKSDYAMEMEKRFPNASPADICRINGVKFDPMPFRCPRCKHRPVRPQTAALESIHCNCGAFSFKAGFESVGITYPHSSADWLKILDVLDAGKKLAKERQDQTGDN
jgi:hypothetical protein